MCRTGCWAQLVGQIAQPGADSGRDTIRLTRLAAAGWSPALVACAKGSSLARWCLCKRLMKCMRFRAHAARGVCLGSPVKKPVTIKLPRGAPPILSGPGGHLAAGTTDGTMRRISQLRWMAGGAARLSHNSAYLPV